VQLLALAAGSHDLPRVESATPLPGAHRPMRVSQAPLPQSEFVVQSGVQKPALVVSSASGAQTTEVAPWHLALSVVPSEHASKQTAGGVPASTSRGAAASEPPSGDPGRSNDPVGTSSTQ
jgi:hypothetical protein